MTTKIGGGDYGAFVRAGARKKVLIAAAMTLGILAFAATPAFAGTECSSCKPWWGLTTSVTPTYLHSGVGKDEVQEITTEPNNVVFVLEINHKEVVGGEFESAPYLVGEYPHATAANVRAALESPSAYGPGNVEVTGQGLEGLPPLTVTTVNEDADRPVSPIELGQFPGRTAAANVVTEAQGDGQITVFAENLGDSEVNGTSVPVTFADKVPPGMEVIAIEGRTNEKTQVPLLCSPATVSCTFTGTLPPYESIEIVMTVKVDEGAVSGRDNEVSVAGGGAPSVSDRQPVTVSDEPVPFGVESYGMAVEDEGGALDTQAGSHPFQGTFELALNQTADPYKPPGLVKDLHFDLPPGLVGNPTPFPQCTDLEFDTFGPSENQCPPDTAMGVASVTLRAPNLGTAVVPVFNMTPNVGEPARFGFLAEGNPVILDVSVRTGGDYGVTVSVDNVTQRVSFLSSRVTLWGVPGDPTHDASRGWECVAGGRDREEHTPPCAPLGQVHPLPFLTLPTSCTGPLQTTVAVDSWAAPGSFLAPLAPDEPLQSLDGCNRLPFSSSISVAPDGQQASTPTGLTVGIHIPQDSTLDASGLSESAVKDTTVVLPEGVQISPAGGGELLACSEGQIGFSGVEAGTGLNLFTAGAAGCPEASKVGTAEITTPLLAEPLVGAVYLGAQDANPFGSLIAMYIDAEDHKAGVVVKLAGEVELNEVTGQVVTVFPNSPQVPFEEAKLHFFGSDRAPLSTPPACGTYTSSASIVPWSGSAPSKSTSTFQITSGPEETPCQDPRPFQPGFQAGTTSVQAGGYSPLTLTMSRPDADQQLGKLSVVLPPGVSAGLRGVKLCEEPQAASGQCPAESQIGTVTASAGLGGDPYSVETGKAYITGPYKGDPFGVDVVVPAVAGPFNLGTEVVRSKVDVDPTDAHLTVVSDPFPTILDGIPLQLQHVNVTVNRPGFVFNPTSCEPMQLTGELESSEGATANVQTPFQVTNCAALTFKPEFKVSTSAKTSRVLGASLHATLTLPAGAQGTKANVARVKVSLPKQLPSPLKTLQKACTEKVFAENPSNCPKASRVGEATVSTPVLEGPLAGPAYFVSHGGAKYPELIMVLTGEDGVTVQVHGETLIKKGITTATFNTVPDVPFSTFELTLPEREYPALTANGNLCKSTLLMPTEIVAQNGAVIKQSTKIAVTGCPRAKKATHKKKRVKHRAHGKKKKR